jgi:ABC-type dipeptide/oligopeptide/nickel transport system permease component
MTEILRKIFAFTPLIWGLAFVAPLTAQIWAAMEWSVPFALSPLVFGLLVGGIWGLYAQIRGTWFWKGERSV